MTREDIVSYLGIKIETVRRIFARFQGEGLLEIHNRHVRILDHEALARAVGRTALG